MAEIERWRRAPSIRAIDCGANTTVIGRDGRAHVFEGDSALLVRATLAALRAPASREELVSRLEAVATGVREATGVVEATLESLRSAGAVVHAHAPRADAPRLSGRIAIGVTGAIAAAHVPLLVERLQARGFEVRVAMTKAATRFVSRRALRALTHHPVAASLDGRRASAPVAHLDLAEWAELVLVAPASATTLSRIAAGDCSDVVSALAISARVPVVIAPSMNAAMLEAPAVARNVEQLVEDGLHVAHSSMALEVADAPDRRTPLYGGWPAIDDLVAIVEHVWGQGSRDGTGPVASAESLATWEALYRDTPAEALPFHSPRLDDDLREVLQAIPRPATLWEIGAGLGTSAADAAGLGFSVTATDLSPRAIALAQERVKGGVRFVVDDIRDSKIDDTFDVVLDRGCFHTLTRGDVARYVEAVTRRTRPGALLLMKLHREDTVGAWRTTRYRLPDLERLWAPRFELMRWQDSTLPGPQGAARVWLAVLRRLT